MSKDKSKTLEKIKELISKKSPKYNKEAKKLAMRNNIKLGKLRKEFCQNCFAPLIGKTRIHKGYRIIHCDKCGKLYRWKMK